jgi:hypothetical protein
MHLSLLISMVGSCVDGHRTESYWNQNSLFENLYLTYFCYIIIIVVIQVGTELLLPLLLVVVVVVAAAAASLN